MNGNGFGNRQSEHLFIIHPFYQLTRQDSPQCGPQTSLCPGDSGDMDVFAGVVSDRVRLCFLPVVLRPQACNSGLITFKTEVIILSRLQIQEIWPFPKLISKRETV